MEVLKMKFCIYVDEESHPYDCIETKEEFLKQFGEYDPSTGSIIFKEGIDVTFNETEYIIDSIQTSLMKYNWGDGVTEGDVICFVYLKSK